MAKLIKKEAANIVWSDDPSVKNKKSAKADFQMEPGLYELHLRPEKKGRGGKTVTVLYNFPAGSEDYFKKMVKKLKRACGSGGTFKGDSIEVQGDHLAAVKKFCEELGFKTKQTGG